ncbi:MAG: FxsA family protein [Planctomycetales bacterium]|nr:FxsA family protein [Planctomycetales bacterium]
MLLRLILLLTVVPLTELFLLMWLADLVNSALAVFGLVILTGVVGASLARWQGAETWRRLQGDLAAGRVPADALLDGLLIFVAGTLLLTPGILTDLIGFALLVPALRKQVKRYLVWRFQARFQGITGDRPPPGRPAGFSSREEIIESRLLDPSAD